MLSPPLVLKKSFFTPRDSLLIASRLEVATARLKPHCFNKSSENDSGSFVAAR